MNMEQSSPETVGDGESGAAAALFGFMGWLTTRDEQVLFGATVNANMAADLVARYIAANNLREPTSVEIQILNHPVEGNEDD